MQAGSRVGLSSVPEELSLSPSRGPTNHLPGRYARHLVPFLLLWLKLPGGGGAKAAPP